MNDEVFILSSPTHKSRPNVTNNSKSVMVEEFDLAPAACFEKNTNKKGGNQSFLKGNNLPYCYTSINEKNTVVCESSLAVDDREKAEGKKSRPITRSLASPKQQPTDVVDKQGSLSVTSTNHSSNYKTLIRLKVGDDGEDGVVLSAECSKIKRMHSKVTPVRLTVEDQSPSRASQHLPKSSDKVNEQPGESYSPCSLVLDEDTRVRKRKSHKRKRSADALKDLDGLDLSPILPRDPSVGGSVSFSDEADFPTAYSPIYSSLGSSFGNLSKGVNILVDRIEDQLSSERRSALASDSLTSTPVNASGSRRKASVALSPGSVSDVKNSTVVQRANEKSEKPVLQVALAQLDTDIVARHNSVGSGNGTDFSLIKRKRSLEDDVEQSKPSKCKRLVEVSSLESDAERNSKCKDYWEDVTSVDVFQDNFRSSVAERVKIQRAISESLQEYERMSTAEDPKSSPARSSPRVTVTRRKSRNFSSSPFAEITNTCTKQRQRAKSDGRMGKLSATCRSSLKTTIDYRSKRQPLSACLIPNDPFGFND